jgi:oligosaccharide repeat unit polymerase
MIPWLAPFFALSVLNYYAGKRDCLDPAFVLSSIWTAVVLVFCLSPIEFDHVSSSTMLIVIFGLFLFSLTCWISNTLAAGERLVASPEAGSLSLWLLAICTIGSTFFLVDTLRIIAEGGADDPALVAVKAAVVGAAGDGSSAYSNALVRAVPNLTFVTALIFLVENKYPRVKWFAVGLAFACAGLTGGRTYLFRVAVGCAFVLLMRENNRTFWVMLRRCAVPLVLFVIVLTFQVLISKVETARGDGSSLAVDYFFLYFCGGIAGFDYAAHNPLLGRSLYLGTTNDFAWIPLPTNVYTMFGFYYFRIGLLGVVLIMLLLGVIHGFLFKRAKTGPLWTVLCAVSMYPLCTSFFDDQYRELRTYINVCILLLAYKFLRGFSSNRSLIPHGRRTHA